MKRKKEGPQKRTTSYASLCLSCGFKMSARTWQGAENLSAWHNNKEHGGNQFAIPVEISMN